MEEKKNWEFTTLPPEPEQKRRKKGRWAAIAAATGIVAAAASFFTGAYHNEKKVEPIKEQRIHVTKLEKPSYERNRVRNELFEGLTIPTDPADVKHVAFQMPEHLHDDVYRIHVTNGALSHMKLTIKDTTTDTYAEVPIIRDYGQGSPENTYLFELPRFLSESISGDSRGWIKLKGPDPNNNINRYDIQTLASVKGNLGAFFTGTGVPLEERLEREGTRDVEPAIGIPESAPPDIEAITSLPPVVDPEHYTQEDFATVKGGALLTANSDGTYQANGIRRIILGDSLTGQHVLVPEAGKVKLNEELRQLIEEKPETQVPIRVNIEGGFVTTYMRLGDLVMKGTDTIQTVKPEQTLEQRAASYVNSGVEMVKTYNLRALDEALEGSELGCSFDDAMLGGLMTAGPLGRQLTSYGVANKETRLWSCKKLNQEQRTELEGLLDTIEERIKTYRQEHCAPGQAAHVGEQLSSIMEQVPEHLHAQARQYLLNSDVSSDHYTPVEDIAYASADATMIRSVAQQYGLSRKQQAHNRVLNRGEKVARRHAAGESYSAIAEDLGCAKSTAQRSEATYNALPEHEKTRRDVARIEVQVKKSIAVAEHQLRSEAA